MALLGCFTQYSSSQNQHEFEIHDGNKNQPEQIHPPVYKEFLIDDFDKGLARGIFTQRKNSLGYYHGTWAKRPSYALITKNAIHRRGNTGAGLSIEYQKTGGWCGWYTLLGEVDARDFNALSFWVFGETGEENFDIGFIDKEMLSLEVDGEYAGSMSNFILSDDGITQEWQPVLVPLSHVRERIELSQLSSIVFRFGYPGKGKVYLEDMRLVEVSPKWLNRESQPSSDQPVKRLQIASNQKNKKLARSSRNITKNGIGKVMRKESEDLGQIKIVSLDSIPPISKRELDIHERMFGKRGKTGVFKLQPSEASITDENSVFYETVKYLSADGGESKISASDEKSLRVDYSKKNVDSFCGVYLIIMGNLSKYKDIQFVVKGNDGGEAFEIGINDTISSKREDAVFSGSIYRYLPQGITTEWQIVSIPLVDFFGSDLAKVYSIVLNFNEIGEGIFWIDEIRFSNEELTDQASNLKQRGYLLLDDFDHSDRNLLGRKANVYSRLPSHCRPARVTSPIDASQGRSLRLDYNIQSKGWAGYYTLLNQVDGEYYDLSSFDRLSFKVKGKAGGENFQIKMADRYFLNIDDSISAGQVINYLHEGVTVDWQEVQIPLNKFMILDWTQMGSLVFNFNKIGTGSIYIDDIKFHLK